MYMYILQALSTEVTNSPSHLRVLYPQILLLVKSSTDYFQGYVLHVKSKTALRGILPTVITGAGSIVYTSQATYTCRHIHIKLQVPIQNQGEYVCVCTRNSTVTVSLGDCYDAAQCTAFSHPCHVGSDPWLE